MKWTTMAGVWSVGIAAACGLWMGAGCEVIENSNLVLSVSPSSTNLTVASQTMVFSVAVNTLTNSTGGTSGTNSTAITPPVVTPLQWTVSDPSLGTIRASGAYTAIYGRNGDAVGNNYLHVVDASGRYEGVAVVSQTLPEEEEEAASNTSTNSP